MGGEPRAAGTLETEGGVLEEEESAQHTRHCHTEINCRTLSMSAGMANKVGEVPPLW